MTVNKKASGLRHIVLAVLRTIVLLSAILLILIITRDIFDNVSFLVDPRYLSFQFWICVIFMFDIVVEFFLGARTWRRLLIEAVFFFLCIPFINIIDYYHIHVSGEVMFLLRAMPMLRAIKKYAAEQEIAAYISLEERMACGVGACLGCVCRTGKIDHHSHVNNARICTDGPVFEAGEVEI